MARLPRALQHPLFFFPFVPVESVSASKVCRQEEVPAFIEQAMCDLGFFHEELVDKLWSAVD